MNKFFGSKVKNTLGVIESQIYRCVYKEKQWYYGECDYKGENYLPDVTVFIDLTPEAAFRRKKGADADDRLEQAGMEFHKRVYEGFKALAEAYPDRFVCINGEQTPDEIFAQVLSALKEKGCL